MTRQLLPLGLLIAAFGATLWTGQSSLPKAHAAATDLDPSWAQSPTWDDGRAEVALYAARRPQYGQIESYEAVLLVVKEDLDPEQHVKAEPPFRGKNLIPVLKLNAVHSYWTERYPYNYMLSLFVRRDAPESLVKASLTGQEWCGNTFKQISTRGKRPELIYSSYFAAAGDGRRELATADLLEDQLVLALRGLRFTAGHQIKRSVLPSLISNQVPEERAVDATITVRTQEAVATPAGDINAWRVEVRGDGMSLDYWFDVEAPHTMIKMTASDGRELLLKQRMREAYWDKATVRPSRG